MTKIVSSGSGIKSIQRGAFTMYKGTSTAINSAVSGVNLSKSYIKATRYCYGTGNGTDGQHMESSSANVYMLNGSTVRCVRTLNEASIRVYWELIEYV